MTLKSFGNYSIVIYEHRIQVAMCRLELRISIPFSVGGMFTTTLQKLQKQPEDCVSRKTEHFSENIFKEHYFLSITQSGFLSMHSILLL